MRDADNSADVIRWPLYGSPTTESLLCEIKQHGVGEHREMGLALNIYRYGLVHISFFTSN